MAQWETPASFLSKTKSLESYLYEKIITKGLKSPIKKSATEENKRQGKGSEQMAVTPVMGHLVRTEEKEGIGISPHHHIPQWLFYSRKWQFSSLRWPKTLLPRVPQRSRHWHTQCREATSHPWNWHFTQLREHPTYTLLQTQELLLLQASPLWAIQLSQLWVCTLCEHPGLTHQSHCHSRVACTCA